MFDAVVFPANYNMSMITSCVVGYAAVGGFTLLQGPVKRVSLKYDNEHRSRERHVILIYKSIILFEISCLVCSCDMPTVDP